MEIRNHTINHSNSITVEFLQIIHLLEILSWIYFACCIVYLAVFALAALFHKQSKSIQTDKQAKMAVVYPAYAEDKVIVEAVKSSLDQDYPSDLYDIIVISDHMQDATNQLLSTLPIRLLQPIFDESSKAKALQYTINHISEDYDALIILDADNRVEKDFLSRMNESYQEGHLAIQAHRTAKHLNTSIALLDAASEEMNNSIFRAGHVAMGLPSALIGSGMLFDFKWFVDHVGLLETAGEDKEFEIFLVREKIGIQYLKEVLVYDEKTPKTEVLKNQRKRWLAAQLFSLKSHISQLPKALFTGNIGYADKIIQWTLPPRILLIAALFLGCIVVSLIDIFWSVKWWILFVVLLSSLLISIPKWLWKKGLLSSLLHIPILTWVMFCNLFHLRGAAKKFIHTEHGDHQE